MGEAVPKGGESKGQSGPGGIGEPRASSGLEYVVSAHRFPPVCCPGRPQTGVVLEEVQTLSWYVRVSAGRMLGENQILQSHKCLSLAVV